MLTFFRRIRKGLITSGATRKYILYAIGEILLVMIGILLALQVNNWNQDRKDNNLVEQYFERLLVDLRQDSIVLSESINRAKQQQEGFYSFTHAMYDRQESKNEYSALISSTFWDATNLIVQDKTFVELTSSGHLSLIRNLEVKESLIQYYREVNSIGTHIEEMNATGIDMFKPFVTRISIYYDTVSSLFDEEKFFELEDWQFINNPRSQEFRNLLGLAGYYSYKQSVFESYYGGLITECSHLMNKIRDELL